MIRNSNTVNYRATWPHTRWVRELVAPVAFGAGSGRIGRTRRTVGDLAEGEGVVQGGRVWREPHPVPGMTAVDLIRGG
jgi:hypothetical protein